MGGGGGGGGWGGKGGGKGGARNPSATMIAQHAKKAPEKVCWIGGLDKAIGKAGDKNLKELIKSLTGSDPKFVNIGPKGQGGAIFGSEAEAQTAIASVSGSSFMGKTLELDVWVKKQK